MFTIPLRRITIHSRLTPRKLQNRLVEIVLAPPPPVFLWQVPAGKIFSGSLSSNAFHLKSLWSSGPKNLWIPTFRGTIYPTLDGSVVVVTISLEGFDALAIIAYHFLFLAAMIVSLRVSFVLFGFTLLLFAMADGLGYYLGFVQGVRFFESEINAVLSEG